MRSELRAGAVLLLVWNATAAAQSRRLNASFPPDHIGAVKAFAIGPGSRAVYAADQDEQGSIELYDAPIDGSAAPIRLAAPGMHVTAALAMTVSPDGLWLVYQTDAFGGLPQRFAHLYSVPMGGGGSVADLSGTLVSGGKVTGYAVGTTRAVYRADALVDETYELFSAPLDGSSAPVRLHGPLVAGGDVEAFAISPDGTRVVYQADSSIDATYELFTVPVDGSSPPVRLHPVLSGSQDAGYLDEPFSPDSTRVVMRANFDTVDAGELYVVPSDGSAAPLRLNPAFASGRSATAYAVDPLSERVVYLADQDADEVFELFSVPLDGGTAVKLNGALVSGGDVADDFQISPDGQTVAYRADELVNNRYELFGVAIDGSAPRVHLNGPLQPFGGGVAVPFRLSPDGARVVYYANEAPGSGVELRSAPMDAAGGSIQLSAPPTANDQLRGMSISGDGRVVYELHHVTCPDPEFCIDTVELFSVPVDGSEAPLELTTDEGGDVEVLVDAASGRAVFRLQRTQDPLAGTSAQELYSVPAAGGEAPVRLHPAFALGGSERDVASFQHTPDGEWVLYTADQDTNGVLELYRASADGTGTPVKLNGPVSALGLTQWFTISPDGAWVVYHPASTIEPLFSVHIDDAAPPVPIGPVSAIGEVRISPDSTRVVYRDGNSVCSGPIDGSASAVVLLSFAPGRGLADFYPPPESISSDSSRFVYVADADTDEQFELYSVPLDGSAPAVKLSGSMVVGGDVLYSSGNEQFRISADASRVVWVADASVDNVAELYSAPLDGSAAPMRLNGTLVAGGDVVSTSASGYRISPDSMRVVYLADELANDRFEIFSAPIDGCAASARLNATFPTGGDVVSGWFGPGFQISPDSTRVVYCADGLQNDRFELFSVPLDGSAAPTKISGTMIALGDVDFEAFDISSDGARVVYKADATIDERLDLFAVPIDGSAAPMKLNGARPVNSYQLRPDGTGLVYHSSLFLTPGVRLFFVALDGSGNDNVTHLPPTASITGFSVHPDSGSVVYIADRVDGMNELWRSTLTPWPRVLRREF